MGAETILKSIEVLPDGTLQIDFECEGVNYRCFSSQGEFFSMYGNAIKDREDKYMAFQQIHQLKQHLDGQIEVCDEETFEVLDNNKAKKEIDSIKDKSGVDYETFKMYILGV